MGLGSGHGRHAGRATSDSDGLVRGTAGVWSGPDQRVRARVRVRASIEFSSSGREAAVSNCSEKRAEVKE